jgi:predicted ATPase/predicted amidohydrolase
MPRRDPEVVRLANSLVGPMTISIRDHKVEFREARDSLRVLLAQISPAYDREVLTTKFVAKVKAPDRQAERILKIIEHAASAEADLLLFPELVAPFSHLRTIEEALRDVPRDLVASIPYEHTVVTDLLSVLCDEEIEHHGLIAATTDPRLVNFSRIFVKAGDEAQVFTQIKLTPFSGEFSLSAKDTLVCGRVLHRFVTNWGTFMFLICKDYVGEVRTEPPVPMFDFLKSLTAEGLHHIFVSAVNPEPEAFIQAARSFYYLQERSSRTYSVFLNTAELNESAIVFPLRPHAGMRSSREVEIAPLFEEKPKWGTVIRFPGRGEQLFEVTLVRLDRYAPSPTRHVFSPVHQVSVKSLSELGIETAELFFPRRERPSKAAPPHNLPAQATPFVGREEELSRIGDLLKGSACRLLTLLGPGGAGKTRLALQAAGEQLGAFPEGVFFVPLAPVRATELIVPTIADSLSFPFSGSREPTTQLLDYLREKQMLVVMDSFEHVLEGAGVVAEILETAPDVRVMATSRERLNLSAEWALEIGGLETPESPTVELPEDYSAIRLFMQSARRARPGFTLAEGEVHPLVQICQLVDGMPLAIELASSWVRMLSCREILGEIEQSLDFLATPARDVPERHRSMRAVFEHSWDLLAKEERDALMRMSIFRGGFRKQAAEEVAGASLLKLSELVDKSLLHRDPSGRYEMHELLRQYAQEKLDHAPSDRQTVRDLHCVHYAAFVHDREERLQGEQAKEALEEIGAEMENVRDGWAWAVKQRQENEMASYLQGVYRWCETRGRFAEGETMFGDAVAALTEVRKKTGKHRKLLLGKLLARQGAFASWLGDYGKGSGLLERSLAILRSLDAPKDTAFSLDQKGLIARGLGDYEEARRLCQESMEIRKRIADDTGMAASLINLGSVAHRRGQYAEAEQFYQEGLAAYRQLGRKKGIAVSLVSLGNVAEHLGDYAEARRLHEEALTIYGQVGDRRGIAACVHNLGNMACALGDYAEARTRYQESLEIKREIGQRQGLARSFQNLGLVARRLGEYAAAKRLYTESLVIAREVGDKPQIVNSLAGLGDTTCALGEPQESECFFRQALSIATEISAIPEALDALVGTAGLLASIGEEERALQLAAFALHHPVAWKETKERAEGLRRDLASQLPAEAVAAAEAAGKNAQMDRLVAEVLTPKASDAG